MADPKSQDLLEILKRDTSIAVSSAQDLINSRRSAEKVLGPDENLFRIDWVSVISLSSVTCSNVLFPL